jgi:hypothetical protein
MDVGWFGVFIIWSFFLWPVMVPFLYSRFKRFKPKSELFYIYGVVLGYAASALAYWIFGVFMEYAGSAFGEFIERDLFNYIAYLGIIFYLLAPVCITHWVIARKYAQ